MLTRPFRGRLGGLEPITHAGGFPIGGNRNGGGLHASCVQSRGLAGMAVTRMRRESQSAGARLAWAEAEVTGLKCPQFKKFSVYPITVFFSSKTDEQHEQPATPSFPQPWCAQWRPFHRFCH